MLGGLFSTNWPLSCCKIRITLKLRHEKSSGVGLYSNDGKINPPPGETHKLMFGNLLLMCCSRKNPVWRCQGASCGEEDGGFYELTRFESGHFFII